MRTPIIKTFTKRKLLSELPFYKSFLEEPNITKYLNAFKNYTHSYKVEVLNSKDLAIPLSIIKTHL